MPAFDQVKSGTETTEYGHPRDTTTPTARYGWLGTHQRATDTPAGLTLMGVRLYNPTTAASSKSIRSPVVPPMTTTTAMPTPSTAPTSTATELFPT